LDGKALLAGELALIAGVSAQSASAHLSKLVAGGLLHVHTEGRHRYSGIASPEVGQAHEAPSAISTRPRPIGIPPRPEATALRRARSCYDHLAGRIAVELRKALESSKIIAPRGDKDYEVCRRGERWFSNLGIEVARLRRSRRSFARQCLAGALGAALYFRLRALGWIAQLPKTRAVRVTPLGQRELQKLFGITV